MRKTLSPHVKNYDNFAYVFDIANSAVARGGAGGARAPPVFFLESKSRPV